MDLATGDVTTYALLEQGEMAEIRSVAWQDQVCWVATEQALYQFDPPTFTLFNDSITGQLAALDDGQLAVLGDSLYHEFDGVGWMPPVDLFAIESVTFSCSFCERSTDVVQAQNGTVWGAHYGFYEYDVLELSDPPVCHDHSAAGFAVLPVESYDRYNRMEVAGGYVWASHWLGLSRYSQGEWELVYNPDLAPVTTSDGVLTGYPMGLAVDQWDRLWWGSRIWSGASAGQLAVRHPWGWQQFDVFDQGVDMRDLCIGDGALSMFVGSDQGLFEVDLTCLPLAISEEDGVGINVFPNPVTDQLHVEVPASMAGNWRVTDTQGRMVTSWMLEAGTNTQTLDSWPAGIYLLQSADRPVKPLRLVVR